MSDTSVALISAGSALVASLITGGLTWLTGRSHLALQLRDQKQARSEQYRREIYAGCIESLTSYATRSLTLVTRRDAQDRDRISEARDEFADASKVLLERSTELELVGPVAVIGAFNTARNAALALPEALDRLAERGAFGSREYSSARDAEMQIFGDALEVFTDAARKALEMD